TGRDGMRLYNEINVNTIANNVITQTNATPSLKGRAFVFEQGTTATMSTNFTAVSSSAAAFINDSTNFRLTGNSPLINAGINVAGWGVLTDLDGNSRSAGYDIGAYTFIPGTATSGTTHSARARDGQRSGAESRLA